MPLLNKPLEKYIPYKPVHLPDRQWPSKVVQQPPIWASTDLRDGNQALATPMIIEKKLLMFRHLVACGFKEIEVGFPSSSDTDFNFVRMLVANNEIPDDVWIQVMMPAREQHILRTFESIRGAKQVLLQLYSASPADIFREIVFKINRETIISMAVEHALLTRHLAGQYTQLDGTTFRMMYGVEGFSQADLDFTIELCSKVRDAWFDGGKLNDHPVTLNVASTVECAPANHFADQIEYFSRHLPNRDEFILGVHTHNDRGTAVAATEHAMLAGAQRVEGCLFGNGERTGNVDLITLALNLYTQGISPGLNFGNLKETISIATHCTEMPIHPRHPYAGSLVYTAFSGSHQDGISKGLRTRGGNGIWRIPYLPMDPTDVGFEYEARVNSQSGRSGAAYIIKEELGLELPRDLQTHFSEKIQSICDREGKEISIRDMIELFRRTYNYVDPSHPPTSPSRFRFFKLEGLQDGHSIHVHLGVDRTTHLLTLSEDDILGGLIQAFSRFLYTPLTLVSASTCISSDSMEVAFVQISERQGSQICWGVGRGEEKIEALVQAFIGAVSSVKGPEPRALSRHHQFGSRPATPASDH